MKDFFIYLFWPNPGNAYYDNPKVIALAVFCALLMAGSYVVQYWRRKQRNPITKKLSKSWSRMMFWMGLFGVFLIVCRAEEISYFAMRFLWVIWVVIAVLYAIIQFRLFRAKHYEVIPTESEEDPRSKYLPQKKRR